MEGAGPWLSRSELKTDQNDSTANAAGRHPMTVTQVILAVMAVIVVLVVVRTLRATRKR